MTNKPLIVNCPSCGESVDWNDRYPERPFCSIRCKNSDFVGWANEEKCIAGSAQYDDIFSESEPSPGK